MRIAVIGAAAPVRTSPPDSLPRLLSAPSRPAPPLLRGWLLLLLLAVAAGSGRLWLLWWETDY